MPIRILRAPAKLHLRLIVALIVGVTFSYPALSADQATKTWEPIEGSADPEGNGLLEFIYGSAPENGILFLPFGIHTQSEDKNWGNNNLIGVVYNSLSAGDAQHCFVSWLRYGLFCRPCIRI